MTRSRHRQISIDVGCQRLPLAHVVTEAQEEDLLRLLPSELRPLADDCTCASPPALSDACQGGSCGFCIGFVDRTALLPCACDHHARQAHVQLKEGDIPPNAAALERWIAHWQERALRAEARIAGVHAQAVDARRRELEAQSRWRDCGVHAATLIEYQTQLAEAVRQLEIYESLRWDVLALDRSIADALHRPEVPGALAAVHRHLQKIIKAVNRGLDRARPSRASREAGDGERR